jgi:peptidoglycan/xylan/chitin deacetylase (PgdA/CDA1 family)
VLNFDDGFQANRDVAERILAPRGIKAAFFVSPGLVGQEGYMGWSDLAALAKSGHVIGAHGMSHRRLAGLRGADLEAEVVLPGEAIAEKLGATPEWFAFPFGDIDSIDPTALVLIGRHYQRCRSGVRGANSPDTHRLAVLADHVDLGSSFAWQRLTVAGGLDAPYREARERLHRWARSTESS